MSERALSKGVFGGNGVFIVEMVVAEPVYEKERS